MNRFISIISKIKWIGLIGFIGNLIFPSHVLRLIELFFLLGLIEIGYIYSFHTFMQAVIQFCMLPYILISHHFKLPAYQNYSCKTSYILPFEGPWTVVNGGIEKELSHSWSLYTQRYAYDFLVLDEDGNSCHDEITDKTNYYCYDKNIIAPADGIIVQANDKILDSRILGNSLIDNKIKDIRGNFIIIKHNDKEFSFLAHIKPGSILVTAGQNVKQGEIIAKCGNSGNSTEPHLHFHLQDGKGIFTSAGLPITFRNIKIKEADNYKNYDKRDIPDSALKSYHYIPEMVQSEGIIHRGQTVVNYHKANQ